MNGGTVRGSILERFRPVKEGREVSVEDALRASPWLVIVRISRRGIPAARWRCVLKGLDRWTGDEVVPDDPRTTACSGATAGSGDLRAAARQS
jgi:hypothetical protein